MFIVNKIEHDNCIDEFQVCSAVYDDGFLVQHSLQCSASALCVTDCAYRSSGMGPASTNWTADLCYCYLMEYCCWWWWVMILMMFFVVAVLIFS